MLTQSSLQFAGLVTTNVSTHNNGNAVARSEGLIGKAPPHHGIRHHRPPRQIDFARPRDIIASFFPSNQLLWRTSGRLETTDHVTVLLEGLEFHMLPTRNSVSELVICKLANSKT